MRIGKKGFTLVEVIVSLAIMTIVAGSVGAFIVAGNNSYLRGNKELTLQEEAQLAANQVVGSPTMWRRILISHRIIPAQQ